MAKPVGSECNLRCRYCYYLGKGSGGVREKREMGVDILERFTEEYIGMQAGREVLFTWHGGEALLRGRGFYEEALRMQRRYGVGRVVENCIQTNGTLLTEDWCKFLRDEGFMVGVSVDGREEEHDRYRRGVGGESTWGSVMKGVEKLRRNGVEYNIMTVVHEGNASAPKELYGYLKGLGSKYIQFMPAVDRVQGRWAMWNVGSEEWGEFLVGVFDEWVRGDVGRVYVQQFDAALEAWVGGRGGTCVGMEECGGCGVIEWNGDVYSCDHFVDEGHKLGNIRAVGLGEMMNGERQRAFGAAKREKRSEECGRCRYLFACNGECPKNREVSGADAGRSRLCGGYRRFFEHIEPAMEWMKNELLHGRAPANIMAAIQARR
ncbi:MAG: anaerobic sulfatase maturase [Tannerellaceae bacterium]|nr:anaerobic sulfatase maturase [Tannerellaceae bacterium]